jgi:hypothetical protein
VAYVDIFDHKGPYIYFMECIGAILSPHSEWGLFLIELFCYSINICFVYKILLNFVENKKARISSMAFLGISFNFFTFVTGNLTDSYSVTFQVISAFLIIDYYFNYNKIEHPPIYMFIHAIMACCCGLMRPVNAGMWIPFGIVLAIRLFIYGKVKNFFCNLIGLLLGIVVGFAPAVIYGVRHSCISDMWYGTVIANMQYTANASDARGVAIFLKNFIFAPEFFIVILAVGSCAVLFKEKYNRWFIATFCTMLVGSLIFMNVSLRNDGQYNQLYMIFTIPIIAFCCGIVLDKINERIVIACIVCFTLIANMQLIKQITKFGVFHYHYDAACAMKEIMQKNPDEKVLVTGTQSLYYNVTDTFPHIRYFIIYGQGLHYEVFPDATLMQANSIMSGENGYIIVNYLNDGSIYGVQEIDTEIKNYLEEYYTEAYKTSEGINTVLYAAKDLK